MKNIGAVNKILAFIGFGATMMLANWGMSTELFGQYDVAAAPISNWTYQRHASTATEGFLRGQGAVIQSAGQAAYLGSLAAMNYQEAARRRIENHHLYVQRYIDNQKLNQLFRQETARTPPTQEQWERIREAALPDRLAPERLDPTTGRLIWPHILRTPHYAAYRDRIEDVLGVRTADNSGDGSPAQRKLAELIDGLRELLKSNRETVSASQFADALWFLRLLDYEALLPLPPSRVTEVSTFHSPAIPPINQSTDPQS